MANRNYTMRYLGIVGIFCLICIIYLGRLFYIQISGKENSYDTGTTTRTVTVQAVRGEIYDRNGVKLVANRYTYKLSVVHAQFYAMYPRQKNDVCLGIREALNACAVEGVREERFFPFEGSAYPYYSYSADATDGESLRYYRLKRVLKDIGLKEDATAEELCEYYVEKYELLQTDNAGNRLYDDDEIDLLIRTYYDMDAVRFYTSGEYVLCESVDMALMTYVKEQNLSAVSFTVDVAREYCYPGYASHILGLVGPIYNEEWEYYNELGYQMNAIVGKSGCEAAFESYLRGTDGTVRIEEDANGNVVSSTVLTKPIAGSDVYLTIDIKLQVAAEDGLAENVAYVVEHATGSSTGLGCNAGAAVAIDPDTFEVLALASYPTYDLTTYNLDYNALTSDEAKPLLNRALNGAYAPGSTLKLGMAAIALLEGQINPSTVVSCTGRYPNSSMLGGVGCSTHGTNHWGGVNVVDGIAYSCNSFFCEMGQRLGIQKMEEYLKKFGLGESTGLELGGTSGILAGPTYRGEIQSEEQWQPGMTWQAAIGQSDHQLSPMQLACYMGTLANGGTRYTAHLLHSVYRFGSDEPSYVYGQNEEVVRDTLPIPSEDLSTVFKGMKKVVDSSNTIQRWINSRTVPVEVGGKTGTAQNSTDCDNALFVCAAPYNEPEIVISVVIEKGYTGGYAALTAGRILEAYYKADGGE